MFRDKKYSTAQWIIALAYIMRLRLKVDDILFKRVDSSF